MLGRGKLVILAFLLMALVAGGVAIVYHRGRAARPLALWGQQASGLMVRGSRVFAYRVIPADSAEVSGEALHANGQDWQVVDRRPIDGARGLVNIRRALLDDATFDWTGAADSCTPQWSHGLEFVDGDQHVHVLFAIECPRVMLVETGASASIAPSAAGFQAFLDEQFAD